MENTKRTNWPTAMVIVVAILAILATLLAGPSLGLDGETTKLALSAEGLLGAIVLGLMRGLRDGDGA